MPVIPNETLNTLGKYGIAGAIIIGCFYVLTTGGDQTQAWSAIFLIVGWIVRDSAGTSATTNAVKTIAATTAAGPVQ